MASIAIDMDDVLNNLMPTWLDAYNREYGDTRAATDITDWDVWKHVKKERMWPENLRLPHPGTVPRLCADAGRPARDAGIDRSRT